jgi:hypothetical protein
MYVYNSVFVCRVGAHQSSLDEKRGNLKGRLQACLTDCPLSRINLRNILATRPVARSVDLY